MTALHRRVPGPGLWPETTAETADSPRSDSDWIGPCDATLSGQKESLCTCVSLCEVRTHRTESGHLQREDGPLHKGQQRMTGYGVPHGGVGVLLNDRQPYLPTRDHFPVPSLAVLGPLLPLLPSPCLVRCVCGGRGGVLIPNSFSQYFCSLDMWRCLTSAVSFPDALAGSGTSLSLTASSPSVLSEMARR